MCLPTAGGAKFGNVEVCLTPTQMQTLFKGQRPTEIACGTRACVFKPKGARTRLVKLTVDESDVGSLLDLQKSNLVPKVYRAFKLRGTTFQPIDPARRSSAANYTYDGASVYAIEVERLQTFEEKLAPLKAACEKFERAAHDVSEDLKKHLRVVDVTATVFEAPSDEAIRRAGVPAALAPQVKVQREALREYERCRERYYAAEAAVTDQMGKLKQALDTKHGFYWSDDHVGNIGFDKTGRMKMIDAGFSAKPAPADLPQLDGRKRRR